MSDRQPYELIPPPRYDDVYWDAMEILDAKNGADPTPTLGDGTQNEGVDVMSPVIQGQR